MKRTIKSPNKVDPQKRKLVREAVKRVSEKRADYRLMKHLIHTQNRELELTEAQAS